MNYWACIRFEEQHQSTVKDQYPVPHQGWMKQTQMVPLSPAKEPENIQIEKK